MSMSKTIDSPSASAGQAVDLKGMIVTALGKSGGTPPLSLGTQDTAITASTLLSSITTAFMQQPNLLTQMQPTIQKSFATPSLQDPMLVLDKSFWGSVCHIVQQAAPIALSVISSLSGGSKDFNAVAQSPEAQRHADDKDWQNFVADVLTQVAPLVVHALRGTKDFSQPGAVTLNLQRPANIKGDEKGWFDDAMKFVGQALPTVLPIVMAAL